MKSIEITLLRLIKIIKGTSTNKLVLKVFFYIYCWCFNVRS